ncbi:hypothetical protein LCGC14_0632660 [marine sediment metagenome]|uniref:Uncharacterized protein n=1 Tax=marine sediment metagenome TaxID=412755 RepID=A0A0F9TMX8_9ZZZZ
MIGEIIFGVASVLLLIASVLMIIYGNRFVNALNEFTEFHSSKQRGTQNG